MNNGIIETMDPILVSIFGIKDLEEISFTNLVPSAKNGRINILPSLYVRYDGGKFLNLCSKDKYFEIYVKKVFDTYMKEKDSVISDPTFNPFSSSAGIKIDDKTKSILESGDLTTISEMYSFYEGKKSYDNSLVFQSDEFRLLLPIIKYHFKQAFDLTDNSVTISNNVASGYRNNYSIDYKINGIDDILLINFIKSNSNETYLKIRSRDKRFKPLEMIINFSEKSIKVEQFFYDYNLHYENTYQIDGNNITHTLRADDGLKTIILKKTNLDRIDNPYKNVSSLDSKDEDMIWYYLPWNAYYGLNDREEKLSEVDSIFMTNNKYLAIVDDEFLLREYASKEYRRKKTQEANANSVVMDEVYKRCYGLLLDKEEGIYLLETYFLTTYGCSGYYRTYLNDQYFYHLIQSKEKLKNLKKENLVSLSKDDDIIIGADLLSETTLKKVLKR